MHRSTSRLAAALGLVLVAPLALAGCSSGADATSSSGGKTELTFLTWSNTKAADGSDVVQNIVKKYEADHPDVTITVNVQAPGSSTDYLKKLDLMQAGGQTADLIQLPSYREYAARASQATSPTSRTWPATTTPRTPTRRPSTPRSTPCRTTRRST